MTRVNGVQNKHGVKTPGKKREALSAAEKSREKIESIALPGVAAPKSTAVPAAQPDAMGRDTYAPASPYAAGLQARQATQTPKSVKTDVSQPSFTQRMADTVSGGLKGTAASMTNMVGTLRELGQAGRDKQNQALIGDYARQLDEAQVRLDAALEDVAKDPGAWSQGDIQSFYNARDDARRKYDAVVKVYGSQAQKGTLQGTYEAADKLQLSSAQDIARAKKGLGIPGQMLVDAGASMTQMAGDAVGEALTGSGMIPLAMRAFGGGAQQARQDGADLKGQVGYGAAIAAKEYVTEKMFGIALPFSRIYGGGAMDDVVKQTIQKAVDTLATTEPGKKALGGVLGIVASGATEGLEDFISDWLEWQMPRIYGGDTDSATETLGNSLYDFGVSFIAGLAGEVLSIGRHTGVDEDTAAQLRQTAEEMSGVKQGTEVVKAQKTAPKKRAAYTMQRDAAGDVYVQIDVDILKGKPRDQWGKTIHDAIKSIFGSGIKLARGTVFTNRKGRGEYTNGTYTKMLERTDPEMYQDKMRMAAGSDGILKSATDVAYEDASHERTDDIVGFNRGKIIVSVKGAGYTGDVLTAVYSDGKETFFDINNLARKTIEAATPERYAAQDGFTQADAATSDSIIPSLGDGVKGEYAPESGEDILAQTAQQMDEEGKQGWRKRNEETIRRAAATFGPVGAQKLQEFYQGSGLSPEEYFGGFAVYYHAGETGQDIMTVRGDYADAINHAQAEAAYLAGQMDAKAQKPAAMEKPGDGEKKGG